MLKKAVFELVQLFYNATKISNVANAVSALALISFTRQNKDNCFGKSELSRNTILHAQWTEGLLKLVRWFLDADDSPNSHQNIIITLIYNVT